MTTICNAPLLPYQSSTPTTIAIIAEHNVNPETPQL